MKNKNTVFFVQITDSGSFVPNGENDGFLAEATVEEMKEIGETGFCWREQGGQTWLGKLL